MAEEPRGSQRSARTIGAPCVRVRPVRRRHGDAATMAEGHPVPITAKTFDVLAVLLEHRDRLVTKDELLDRVWPDTAVQENNLARQVSSLRRALAQRPDEADYVLTIPGQGYRFVANAQEIPELPGGLRDANGTHHLVPPEPAADIDDVRADDGSAPSLVIVSADGTEAGSPSATKQGWSLAALVGHRCPAGGFGRRFDAPS